MQPVVAERRRAEQARLPLVLAPRCHEIAGAYPLMLSDLNGPRSGCAALALLISNLHFVSFSCLQIQRLNPNTR